MAEIVEKSTEKWDNFISKNECFERNEKTDKISAFFSFRKGILTKNAIEREGFDVIRI